MKKKWIAILCAVVVLIGSLTTVFILKDRKDNMKNITVEKAYDYQFTYFSLRPTENDPDYVYLPFSEYDRNYLYCFLAYYEQQTGNTLTVEEIKDYLSQEYEEDGTLRLFNNGRHPKILEYIKWATTDNHGVDMNEYLFLIVGLSTNVKEELGLDGKFENLTYASLDELMKKETDPNYKITSLDYEEHGAVLKKYNE